MTGRLLSGAVEPTRVGRTEHGGRPVVDVQRCRDGRGRTGGRDGCVARRRRGAGTTRQRTRTLSADVAAEWAITRCVDAALRRTERQHRVISIAGVQLK